MDLRSLFLLCLLPLLTACPGGSSNNTSIAPSAPTDMWIWVSGSYTVSQPGVYGTKGVADLVNVPGARDDAISWIDASGDLWLFGGWGYDSAGSIDRLNDLWRFDGSQWAWVSGSDTSNQTGVYGTKGVADAANVPGGRSYAISWMDTSGDLWLFGGLGYDSEGSDGRLNDLWRFDGSQWAWVSGGDTRNQTGVYGTKGVADAANVPGARYGAISWIDASDDLWLFGGWGYDKAGIIGRLNDLWRFDGSQWAWVSGSDTRNQTGVYGTKGVVDAANVPGGRMDAISWIDASGDLWLFGGLGYASAGVAAWLNDLWRFDGSQWTWVSGSDTHNQASVYGTKGVANAANVPGARQGAISWIDGGGDLWLFGGSGFDSMGVRGTFNDLWRFDGSQWTWVSGSDSRNQPGVYSIKGVVDAANVPGARQGPISWIDGGSNLWLFGGYGFDNSGNQSRLNDLWRYQP